MSIKTEHESTSPIVTSSQIVELAQIAFASGSMYHVEGQGGGGKTSILQHDLAEAMGIPPERVFKVNCSGYPPSELVGYGIPDSETHDMWFARPEQWPHALTVGGDDCLLILDEFTQWAPEAQSLCRSLFDPVNGVPMIGTHELGSNVKICITSNRAVDGSRSLRVDAPTSNRCMTNTLAPDLDDCLAYYANQGLGLSPLFAFLKYTQGLNETDHFNPAIGKGWDGGPHATPRSWEFALRYTKDLDMETANARTLETALKGWVGMKAGAAACAFLYTISAYIPRLKKIRAHEDTMPTGDPSAQYSIAYAALRTAKKELKASDAVPSDAVVSGQLDWLVDDIIIPAEGELRGWAYRTAIAIGIQLEKHDRRHKMQSL